MSIDCPEILPPCWRRGKRPPTQESLNRVGNVLVDEFEQGLQKPFQGSWCLISRKADWWFQGIKADFKVPNLQSALIPWNMIFGSSRPVRATLSRCFFWRWSRREVLNSKAQAWTASPAPPSTSRRRRHPVLGSFLLLESPSEYPKRVYLGVNQTVFVTSWDLGL